MDSDESVQEISNKVAFFYIDETLLEIEDKKHVIVCAITPHSLSKSILKMVEVKETIGFDSLDEVKINTKGLTQDLKIKLTDGVLDIMGDCTAFISIIEGENKQKAAEMLAWQLFDYCNQNDFEGYFLYFDKDLVPKASAFETFVRNDLQNGAKCIGIQHLNSTSEQLIQCCDVFLGLYRLSMEIELGNREITRKYYIRSPEDVYYSSLSDYVNFFSRQKIWGKQENKKLYYEFEGKLEDVIEPYHCSFGLGVRIDSTISKETKQIIEDKLSTVYLGCLL